MEKDEDPAARTSDARENSGGRLQRLVDAARFGSFLSGDARKELHALSLMAIVLLAIGLSVGFLAVIMYAFWAAATHTAAFTAIFLALGALVIGVLVGVLFGLPRAGTLSRSETTAGGGSRYIANTNLEDVSDWLTKILVGIGLVQLREIADAIGRLGSLLAEDLGGAHNRSLALTLLLYFSVIGFLIGYLWARVSFWQILVLVDEVYPRPPDASHVSAPTRSQEGSE